MRLREPNDGEILLALRSRGRHAERSDAERARQPRLRNLRARVLRPVVQTENHEALVLRREQGSDAVGRDELGASRLRDLPGGHAHLLFLVGGTTYNPDDTSTSRRLVIVGQAGSSTGKLASSSFNT